MSDESFENFGFNGGPWRHERANLISSRISPLSASRRAVRYTSRTSPGRMRSVVPHEKTGHPYFCRDDIGDQAGMSAVSIRKRMNHDKFAMKADGAFVCIVCLVFRPILRIPKRLHKSFTNVRDRNAEILFCLSICSRPRPCLVEHPTMEFSNIVFAHRI
jgi:hypothetical protein